MAEKSGGWLSGGAVVLLFCASFGANILLSIRVFRTGAVAAPPSSTEMGAHQPKGGLLGGVVSSNQAGEVTSTSFEGAAPFSWLEIESTDYRQYIANLRAVGCPESVVRDIIGADLGQLFASRTAVIWTPVSGGVYWKRASRDQPDGRQMKELVKLAEEKSAIFQQLLGKPLDEQMLVDTLFLQLHGSEQQLLFLPEGRRQAAMDALSELDMRIEKSRDTKSEPGPAELYADRLKLLAKVLSPAELEEFKLRNSPAAENLRVETQYFDLTPEEFKALFEARSAKNATAQATPDLLNRTAATEEVRQLFGEERAAKFERVSDMFYINSRRLAEERGFSMEQADRVWQVTRDTRAAAAAVWSDTSIVPEKRTARLEELLAKARAQLTEALDGKSARPVVRDLRTVVLAPPAPGQR